MDPCCPFCKAAPVAGTGASEQERKCAECGAVFPVNSLNPVESSKREDEIKDPLAPAEIESAIAEILLVKKPGSQPSWRDGGFAPTKSRSPAERENPYAGWPKPLVPMKKPEPGWQTVRAGLRFLLVGHSFSLAIVAVILILPAHPPQRGPSQELQVIPWWLGCGYLVGGAICLVGYCMCCAMPKVSGLLGSAISTLVLKVLGVILPIVALLVMMLAIAGTKNKQNVVAKPPPSNASFYTVVGLAGAGQVASILGTLFLLRVLRGIALRFQRPLVAKSALALIVVAVLIVAGSLMFLGVLQAHADKQVDLFVGVALSGYGVLALWFLSLLYFTQSAIPDEERS